MALKVGILVHDPNGDMGDATVIGPFSSWGRAEAFRDEHYPYEDNLEAIIISMAGPRDFDNHPSVSSP